MRSESNTQKSLPGSQALLCDERRTMFLDADLRDPDAVLDGLRVHALLDLDRPVAVLFPDVLANLADRDDPHGVVDAVLRATAPGSALVVSHDARTPRNLAVARLHGRAGIPAVPRERADVERFFADAPLVEPGLVDVTAWRAPSGRRATSVLAGVGRTPTSPRAHGDASGEQVPTSARPAP